jgi:tRNA threonylcarbamoyladenosine biosynthesis protein TsaB
MNLLAIDTSSIACTIAVQIADSVVERHEEQPREHTRLLMPMIRDALQEADAQLTDLDAIVLGNGPGSFIGMRIAASVSQGLAHGAGLKIIPVSSLAAVAAEVFATSSAAEVAVAQDAHMSEVYLGLFSRGKEGIPVPMAAERLHRAGRIDEFSAENTGQRVAAGEGWQRYPDLKTINESLFSEYSDVLYPHAKYLLSLADRKAAIEPRDISPSYLRQKVAEKPVKAGS